MASVDFEGRDLEEAIGRAAAALNMPPEQVKFSVISMGAKGFLGLGRKKARIAVNPDDPALSLDEPEEKQKRPARQEPGDDSRRDRRKTPAPAEQKTSDASPSPKKTVAPTAHAKRNGRAPAESAPQKHAEPLAAVPEIQPLDWSHLPPVLTRPDRDETRTEGPGDQAGELALTVTREILTRLGFEAEITAARINARVILSLESPDNALLIGARGATLEALQLLVNKIVARRLADSGPAPEADCRVVLDVADYRGRRREHLVETLKNLAEQARRTRRPQTMTGLSSDERRLIQLALRPFKDLRILSSGGREALTIATQSPSAAPRPRRRMPGGRA
jgi:spoIIIJ-associated protein